MALQRGVRGDVYVQKTRVELTELEEGGVTMAGNAFSSVLLVKGTMGPAEQAGGALLSGADGKALRAALLKLGYAPEDWMAISAPADPELLRQAVVAVDPATLVMCDEAAASAIREAFADDLVALANPEDALLSPGCLIMVAGIRMLNLGGFEAALQSNREKQRMWAYLKQIPPLGEPY